MINQSECYLISNQGMESQGKRNDEQQYYQGKLEEGLQHVREHYNIDSQKGKFTQR